MPPPPPPYTPVPDVGTGVGAAPPLDRPVAPVPPPKKLKPQGVAPAAPIVDAVPSCPLPELPDNEGAGATESGRSALRRPRGDQTIGSLGGPHESRQYDSCRPSVTVCSSSRFGRVNKTAASYRR